MDELQSESFLISRFLRDLSEKSHIFGSAGIDEDSVPEGRHLLLDFTRTCQVITNILADENFCLDKGRQNVVEFSCLALDSASLGNMPVSSIFVVKLCACYSLQSLPVFLPSNLGAEEALRRWDPFNYLSRQGIKVSFVPDRVEGGSRGAELMDSHCYSIIIAFPLYSASDIQKGSLEFGGGDASRIQTTAPTLANSAAATAYNSARNSTSDVFTAFSRIIESAFIRPRKIQSIGGGGSGNGGRVSPRNDQNQANLNRNPDNVYMGVIPIADGGSSSSTSTKNTFTNRVNSAVTAALSLPRRSSVSGISHLNSNPVSVPAAGAALVASGPPNAAAGVTDASPDPVQIYMPRRGSTILQGVTRLFNSIVSDRRPSSVAVRPQPNGSISPAPMPGTGSPGAAGTVLPVNCGPVSASCGNSVGSSDREGGKGRSSRLPSLDSYRPPPSASSSSILGYDTPSMSGDGGLFSPRTPSAGSQFFPWSPAGGTSVEASPRVSIVLDRNEPPMEALDSLRVGDESSTGSEVLQLVSPLAAAPAQQPPKRITLMRKGRSKKGRGNQVSPSLLPLSPIPFASTGAEDSTGTPAPIVMADFSKTKPSPFFRGMIMKDNFFRPDLQEIAEGADEDMSKALFSQNGTPAASPRFTLVSGSSARRESMRCGSPVGPRRESAFLEDIEGRLKLMSVAAGTVEKDKDTGITADGAKAEFGGQQGHGQAQATLPYENPPQKKKNQQPDRKLHFLVVDDDPVSRKCVRRMLISRGHEVSVAVNGIECLKALDAAYESGSPFDAVLLDECMPLMSGHETADAIRSKGFHVPIYSLTSQSRDSPLDDYRDYGIDAVMLKPLNLNELGEYMRLQDRWRRGSTGSIPIRPGTLMDGGIDEGVEDNGSV